MLYALRLGPARLPFTYPPFAALLFAAVSGASLRHLAGRADGGHDRAAAGGGVPVPGPRRAPGRPGQGGGGVCDRRGEPSGSNRWRRRCSSGRSTYVLLALVVRDLALPDHVEGKGIGIGLAAGIKLRRLIFIPYLLFTRRVKAAAVAALTSAVTVGLGFALLPHASAIYWHDQFFRPSKYFHLDDQSLNGVILRLTHVGPDAHEYWLVAAVVVGVAGLATAILASGVATSYSGWSRAPRPACWCPPSAGRTTTCTWCLHLSSPRTGHGAAATGSSAPRWWWACLAGGRCALAARAATTLSAQLLPRGLLLLAPKRGQQRVSRVHLARAGIDRRQLLRAHPARVYRGHRLRSGTYPSHQA